MKTTSLVQNIFRILLGLFLAFAGISHLTFNRSEFLAQVPQWVPLNTDWVVLLSGVAEIALGLFLLFFTKLKDKAGIVAAIFFVLVFPGNISQYVNHISAFGLTTDGLRLARLFFQPLRVLWALWSTGVFQKKRDKTIYPSHYRS